MPVPQEMNFIVVEQVGKPVHKRLIKNASRCQLNQTVTEILSQLIFV